MNSSQAISVKDAVCRAEDLPYMTSRPIQYTYESTATLNLGTYTWADTPALFTPNRPIIDNALYFFRNISLTADVSELDYETAITTVPKFYSYLESDSKAVLFREPIHMNKYYDQFDYRFWFASRRGSDILYGGFQGILLQTPGLVGKNTITLKAIISAQEVVDEQFIDHFLAPYPKQSEDVREMDT